MKPSLFRSPYHIPTMWKADRLEYVTTNPTNARWFRVDVMDYETTHMNTIGYYEIDGTFEFGVHFSDTRKYKIS